MQPLFPNDFQSAASEIPSRRKLRSVSRPGDNPVCARASLSFNSCGSSSHLYEALAIYAVATSTCLQKKHLHCGGTLRVPAGTCNVPLRVLTIEGIFASKYYPDDRLRVSNAPARL